MSRPPSAISILAVVELKEQVAAIVEDPTIQLIARQDRELRDELAAANSKLASMRDLVASLRENSAALVAGWARARALLGDGA